MLRLFLDSFSDTWWRVRWRSSQILSVCWNRWLLQEDRFWRWILPFVDMEARDLAWVFLGLVVIYNGLVDASLEVEISSVALIALEKELTAQAWDWDLLMMVCSFFVNWLQTWAFRFWAELSMLLSSVLELAFLVAWYITGISERIMPWIEVVDSATFLPLLFSKLFSLSLCSSFPLSVFNDVQLWSSTDSSAASALSVSLLGHTWFILACRLLQFK